jgi:hypothetical protein
VVVFRRLVAAGAVLLLASASAAWPAAAAPVGKPPRARGAKNRTGRATPALAELVRAARKNDRAALDRLAARFGVARLGEALGAPDGAVAQAALQAIPLVRGRALLIAPVTEKLDTPAAPLAAQAARTLGALLDGAALDELAEWEVTPETLARACAGLHGLASRATSDTSTRLAALEALGLAQSLCVATADLAPLLHDPSAAVRRATALVLKPADRQAAAALRDAAADPDPTVASAAVAALCRRAPAPRAKGPREPTLPATTAAARALAASAATPPEDAVEMLDCLALAGTPADKAVLEQLRATSASTAVRARAAELADGGARARAE